LVVEGINDSPLLKFDLVMRASAAGDVKFTVVKWSDALPEPEPEAPATLAAPSADHLPLSDNGEVLVSQLLVRLLPPPRPIGSHNSDSSQGASKKKNKHKRGNSSRQSAVRALA
jgi:hypothetical protein